MEIENERYGRRVLTLLPLTNGRIAVLYPNKQLYMVVDTFEEACFRSGEAWARYVPHVFAPPVPEIDLMKELGL